MDTNTDHFTSLALHMRVKNYHPDATDCSSTFFSKMASGYLLK